MKSSLRHAFIRAVIACLSSILVAVPAISLAQISEEALNHRLTTLYQEVLSPFCPGRSLNDCPSSKAQELKNSMRQQIEAGASNEQVLNQVFTTYGEQYRAVPRYDGFGKLVWWMPVVFLVLGGCSIGILVTRRQKNALSHPPLKSEELPDDLRRLLKEELDRIE
jgi:cytochrome c-type biogenesis protein CcmH